MTKRKMKVFVWISLALIFGLVIILFLASPWSGRLKNWVGLGGRDVKSASVDPHAGHNMQQEGQQHKMESLEQTRVTESGETETYYTCTMHPSVRMDRPGNCPICGMELVKKTVRKDVSGGERAGHEGMEGMPGMPGMETQEEGPTETGIETGGVTLSLSREGVIMSNVETSKVKLMSLSKDIRAYGAVNFDERRLGIVTSWIMGRIDRLYINATGQHIKKGAKVMDIYSPDLVQSEEEFLLALKTEESLKDSKVPGVKEGASSLVEAAKKKLLRLGLTDKQIEELMKTRKVIDRIPIYSKYSGIVIEKNAFEGMYVDTGEMLFKIADLSRVWIEGEVFEFEMGTIREGQAVTLTSPAFQGKSYRGRISFIYPELNMENRTAKIRVEVSNPGLLLRPGMYVDVMVKATLGRGLVVPRDSLLDLGTEQIVWVRKSGSLFERRRVTVRELTDDYAVIKSGLKDGEEVVTNAGFLIDSESKITGGGMGTGHQHGGEDSGKAER